MKESVRRVSGEGVSPAAGSRDISTKSLRSAGACSALFREQPGSQRAEEQGTQGSICWLKEHSGVAVGLRKPCVK